MRVNIKHLMFGVCVAFVFCAFVGGASAATWHVDDDRAQCPEADFTKIQDAVNAASSGDTIIVYPGTYVENIFISNKHVTLRGQGVNTIIDGGNSGTVIYVYKPQGPITIEGFTIRNGGKEGSLPGNAGIHINFPSQYTIKNCRIEHNGFGIVIWNTWASNCLIENCVIADNAYRGIDPYCEDVIIDHCTIVNNGGDGYGDWSGSGVKTIKNSIICFNGRYGIYSHRDTPKAISYNDVFGNSKGNYYEGYWGPPTPFTPSPGTGEISTDPLFMDPAVGDYRLSENSPCIGAGEGGTNMGASFSICAPPENQPPTASFTYSPQNPVVGEEITFDASSSYDPDGTIVSYDWDFGDGAKASGDVVTHAYSSAGDYTVILTVTDNEGAKNSMSKTISVIYKKSARICIRKYDPWCAVPVGTVTATYERTGYDEEKGNRYRVTSLEVKLSGFLGDYKVQISDADGNVIWSDGGKKWKPSSHTETYTPNIDIYDNYRFGIELRGMDAVTAIMKADMWVADWYIKGAKKLSGMKIPDLEKLAEIRPDVKEDMKAFKESPIWFSRKNETPFALDAPEYSDFLPLLWPSTGAILCSPGELRVYDSKGRVTGLVNGEVREEIPNSTYFEGIVYISHAESNLTYTIVGTEEGNYSLMVAFAEENFSTYFTTCEVPLSANAIHYYNVNWQNLAQNGSGITVEKDYDGDGEVDEAITTSVPKTPTNPSPPDGATDVPINTILSWTGDDSENVAYNVYFGTDIEPPLVSERQVETTYAPTLEPNTTYYWRVLAINEHNIFNASSLWSFTTTEDTVSPVIHSVTLDAYTTIPDAIINITVNATDDVGVVSVTAEGIPLLKTDGIWEGNITAPSSTGEYTLTIRAEDAAGNYNETTVDYSVVKPSGSIGIGVDPRLTTISAGDTAIINITLVSTENFDDVAYVYLTTEGIDPMYEANMTWFNWTSRYVSVPAGSTVKVPLNVSIPEGESGYKMFYVYLESKKWTTTAMDTGVLYIT